MPRCRHLLAFVLSPSSRAAAGLLTPTRAALFAPLALLALVTATADAQGAAAYDTPLHLPANSFEFVASGDAQPLVKPLRIHNGGSARFTDVRLTRLAYADSARGAAWLVALPLQSAVAPDELATIGTLCIDATGLRAGTYRATAAVRAREVREPVPITITLVVTDAGARARQTVARCKTATTK
jgi:hypothetical protein